MGHVEYPSHFVSEAYPIIGQKASFPASITTDSFVDDANDVQDLLNSLQSDLMRAALSRNGGTMNFLLQNILDQNDISLLDEINAVHWAAYCGDTFLTCRLLGMGCDIQQEDNLNRETPIFFAVKGVNFDIIKLLVEFAGIEILNHKNRTNLTPFLTAAAEFPEDRIREMLCIIEWLYLQGLSLEQQDDCGHTALFWSAKKGNVSLMQWLLSHGANMAHRDFMGNSVLHVACSSGNEDAILFLCENGAIELVGARSIEDERHVGNTVFGICQIRRYFFLYMSLWKWSLQYRWFGFVRIFKTVFAWYYWILSLINVFLFINIASFNGPNHFLFAFHDFIWVLLWLLTQVSWVLNPGCARDDAIIPQFKRVSSNFSDDIYKPPVYPRPPNSSIGKLQLLEREQLEVNAACIEINRECHRRMISASQHQLYKQKMEELLKIRMKINEISKEVSIERQNELPKAYIRSIMESSSTAENICVTCKIVRPVRVHHCSSCARCIHRQDHHCVWIDNCIGGRNQQWFFLFLLFLCANILWNYYVLLKKYAFFSTSPSQIIWLLLLIIVGIMMNAASFWFVLYLFCRTSRSMITNVTSYEHLKRPDHIKRRFFGNTSGLLWDLRDLTLQRAIRNIYGFWTLDPALDDEYIMGSLIPTDRPRNVSILQASSVYSALPCNYHLLQEIPACDIFLPFVPFKNEGSE